MLKGVLLVFFGACSFGILSTFVKLAYHEGYTLGEVTGAQSFLGAILLWSIFLIQSKRSKKQTQITESKTPWWKLVLAGFSTGLVSVFYYQCVKLVPNSIAIILLMQFIWMSILMEYFFFKKKPTKLQLFAIALVLGGTILASGMLETNLQSISMVGVGFGLLAAICYAVFLLINGRLGNEYSALHKSALMITGSCLIVFILFPPVFLVNGALYGSLLKWGLIIAVFGTVIPPLFYAEGIPKIGLALSSILSSAELPVAVLLSALVLHEPVSLLRWVGVAVILSALMAPNLSVFKKRKRGSLS
ncbi:EamA family transporter [Pedobacter sp. MW01-1-1]|uniref:EamA family transporter n=1 Tax=Pedobacter sp. MW01-1-1 TaxID=3383027 RepID=UPI003FF06F58